MVGAPCDEDGAHHRLVHPGEVVERGADVGGAADPGLLVGCDHRGVVALGVSEDLGVGGPVEVLGFVVGAPHAGEVLEALLAVAVDASLAVVAVVRVGAGERPVQPDAAIAGVGNVGVRDLPVGVIRVVGPDARGGAVVRDDLLVGDLVGRDLDRRRSLGVDLHDFRGSFGPDRESVLLPNDLLGLLHGRLDALSRRRLGTEDRPLVGRLGGGRAAFLLAVELLGFLLGNFDALGGRRLGGEGALLARLLR